MDKEILSTICKVLIVLAMIAWIIKFALHYFYRKAIAPPSNNIGLQQPGFSSFQSSYVNNTTDRFFCILPWIFRDKKAEEKDPALAKKGKIILYLSITFIVCLGTVIFIENYFGIG